MDRARVAALLLLVLTLAGCSIFESLLPGGEHKVPLTGKRESILNLEGDVHPDPAIESLQVRLPQPTVNRDWPEAGGYPTHAMQHLALRDAVHRIWSRSVGEGDSDAGEIMAAPVVEGGRIFTMDAESKIAAFDANTGRELWKFDPKPRGSRTTTFGGGLAALGDQVFVTTGYAQVLALRAQTGRVIWRHNVPSPVHSPPTVADGRVYAVTIENELHVLSTTDGHELWSHNGLPEPAGLLGGASPAVEGEIAVVAYTSGEIYALGTENGHPLWNDSLASAQSLDAMTALADIRGRPIIDHGMVFAVSHSGRMLAIDLRTGDRVWEQDIGGSYSPWIAGEFIYLLTNDNSLVCLTRREGKVKWVLDLPVYQNAKKKRDPIEWAGPVLAGDRLIVISSDGSAVAVSPYTGKALGRIEISDGGFVAPVLADETLYVLTSDADLIAYR